MGGRAVRRRKTPTIIIPRLNNVNPLRDRFFHRAPVVPT
jgi:hypothetical protein